MLREYDSDFNTVPRALPTSSEIESAVHAIRTSGPPLTHYETHAIASYATFASLQAAGQIPRDTKFQVSLPTPINVIVLLAEGYQAALEPLYEEQLLKALRSIEAAIPHDKLCIQWDFACEFALLEGVKWPHFNLWFDDVRNGVLQRVIRLVQAVSEDVEVGVHLCYGDIGNSVSCSDPGHVTPVSIFRCRNVREVQLKPNLAHNLTTTTNPLI